MSNGFCAQAADLSVAGLLLTDLPAGSDPTVESTIQASPLDLIRLVAPTTRPERVAAAVSGAQGFIYLVARLGVTGATPSLARGLGESIAQLRRTTVAADRRGLRDEHAPTGRGCRKAGRRCRGGKRAG